MKKMKKLLFAAGVCAAMILTCSIAYAGSNGATFELKSFISIVSGTSNPSNVMDTVSGISAGHHKGSLETHSTLSDGVVGIVLSRKRLLSATADEVHAKVLPITRNLTTTVKTLRYDYGTNTYSSGTYNGIVTIDSTHFDMLDDLNGGRTLATYVENLYLNIY